MTVLFIQGLPGSGKTTLAARLRQRLNAIHLNADWARATVTSHLGFSEADRLTQARTLGQMARMLQDQGHWVIVDFVCPTPQTRNEFFNQFMERKDVYSVWMNTIAEGRFADTNKLYTKPGQLTVDYEVDRYLSEDDMDRLAETIATTVTKDHATFYVRYNTHTDGVSNLWRVIDAETREEVLVDSFDLRGIMTPAMTIEHGVEKWNVAVTGKPSFTQDEFKRTTFSIRY